VNKIGSLNRQYKTATRILKAIATHENVDGIVQQLKRGENHEAIAQQIESIFSLGSESNQDRTEDRSTPFEQETKPSADQGESKERHTTDRQHRRNDTVSLSTKLNLERELHDINIESDSSDSRLSSIYSGRIFGETDLQAVRPDSEAQQSSSSASIRQQIDGSISIAKSWTNATADQDFVNHLLSLYFCWEYSAFASFSKVHFLHDFRTGRRRFCSSLLVNVILSLNCRFSDKAEAQLDLHKSHNNQIADDRFFEEARAILTGQEDQSLPTFSDIGANVATGGQLWKER